MKNTIRRISLVMSALLVVAVISFTDFGGAQAAPPPKTAPFAKVFQANANGAIISIGNSLLTCPDTAGQPCVDGRAGGAWDNNDYRMVHLDVDADASTYNSSSSQLNLPDGAQVLFAGLYWGARLDAGSQGVKGDPDQAQFIKLKVPGDSAYQDIEGTVVAQNGGQKNAYQSYKDITGIVKAAGNGDYWGANVNAGTGLDRYAGWALTVVYSAPSLPLRNLTVFQGFETVGSGYPQDIEVSGFLAPETGQVDA
ncbi:MAG: hypothetical protein LBO20_09745, partial [Bifidobacteriaceae bacterium]|nr:hypothetical protein [Bifidobacteriaceae bacterium]